MRAFWSNTDDRDEQGFRIYGVIGKLDSDTPERSLRTTLRVANTRRSVWLSLSSWSRSYIIKMTPFSDTNNSPFKDLEKK